MRAVMRDALLLLAGGLAAACGAAAPRRGTEPGPYQPPQPPWVDTHPYADLRVLRSKPVPAVFATRYGVHPTVDTEAEPTSTVLLRSDTASFGLARAVLDRGALPEPAAVRPEEFVQAFAPAFAPEEPAVEAGPYEVASVLFPSPNRRGYHVLALALAAPPSDAEARAVRVVVDAGPAHDAEVRAALEAIEAAVPRERLSVQRTAGRDELPARLRDAEARTVVLLTDGRPRADVPELEALARRTSALHVLAFVPPDAAPYDDAALERLARAGAGTYHVGPAGARRVTEALFPVDRGPALEVQFDRWAVARWRLVGYEGPSAAALSTTALGSVIPAGATLVALYEVRLRDGAGPQIGRVAVRRPFAQATAPDETPLTPVPGETWALAPGWARVAWLTAAFAEKLRGSYWARTLTYDALVALHGSLPPPARGPGAQAELGRLIGLARDLDRRADPFAEEAPLDTMDFDEVPAGALGAR